MANAIGNRSDLAFLAETSFGVTPATPQLTALNVDAGSDLNKEQTWFEDTSLRSDRNRIDTYAGSYVVKGQFAQSLRPTEPDALWESLLWSTWASDVLKNGVTRKSFVFERAFNDIAAFQVFNGVLVDSLKLDIKNNAPVKATWNLIGTTAGAMSGTTVDTSGGYTAQATATPFLEGSAVITEGGSALAYATDVSLDISNGISAANTLGSTTAADLTPAAFTVKGSMKALFPSFALYNKFFNNTSSSLQITLTSGANSITILMSTVRFTKVAVPTTDGLIEQDIQFEAFYNPTDAAAIKITRA